MDEFERSARIDFRRRRVARSGRRSARTRDRHCGRRGCALAVAFILGIKPRLEANAALKKETHELSVPTVSVIRPKPGEADPGARAARQRAGLHRHADLCADQRLSQALVRRHRCAREGRAAAGRDRHARRWTISCSRRAPIWPRRRRTTRSPQRPPRAGRNCSRPDSCRKQEDRPDDGDMQAKKAAAGLGTLQRRAPGEAAVVQEDLRAVRRRDHRAQHRRRRADRRRQRGRARQGAVPPRRLPTACASTSAFRSSTRATLRRASPADLTLAEFPDRRFKGTLVRTTHAIDAGLAHAAGRGGSGQPHRRAAARRLRAGPLQAQDDQPGAGAAGQHADVPLRRRRRSRWWGRISRWCSRRSCSAATSAPRSRWSRGWSGRFRHPQSVGFPLLGHRRTRRPATGRQAREKGWVAGQFRIDVRP